MNTRGVELALNTVIIAAIALIVLIVLIVVFTGGFGDVVDKLRGIFNKVPTECVAVGGIGDADGDGYVDVGEFTVKCKESGKVVTKTCSCNILKTQKDGNYCAATAACTTVTVK